MGSTPGRGGQGGGWGATGIGAGEKETGGLPYDIRKSQYWGIGGEAQGEGEGRG